MNGMGDLLVPVLILLVGGWLAVRGGGDPVGTFLAQREARRVPLPPARPRVSGAGRAFNPFDLRPRAIEWAEGEIEPDPWPVIDVLAREVEPVEPPPSRQALARPRPAIEPRRRAIGPGPSDRDAA